jgi:hypothetical protein
VCVRVGVGERLTGRARGRRRRYAIMGPPGTPYEGGVYHGKLKFPTEFPFKPPSIFMITPSGARPPRALPTCAGALPRPD